MRTAFLLLLFSFPFRVFSASESSGWYEFGWLGWGLGSSGKSLSSYADPKEAMQERTEKESRILSSVFRSGVDKTFSTDRFRWKIQTDLSLSPDSGIAFFAGKNLYLEWKTKNTSVFLGRKREETKRSSFRDWIDGTDGVIVESSFGDLGRIRLDLFDFYSGFPLFEKKAFAEKILKSKPKMAVSSEKDGERVVTEENTSNSSFQNRYRGGVSYGWSSEFLDAGIRFQYLNLQNWGNFSNDLKADPSSNVSSGDRDYLTHSTVELNWKWNGLYCFLSGILARGQDKTNWNRNRNSSSIPISGEAILVSLGVTLPFGDFHLFGFLPDRDKRNSQDEVLELGFVGMGSSPSPVFATIQSLDFYPSAWITDRGLEKRNTRQGGRRQSAWFGADLEYKKSLYQVRLYFASYTFLSETGEHSGALTISKETFQRRFFREFCLQGSFYFPSENPKIPFSFLKLSLGGWIGDPSSDQKEIFFQIQTGAIL
ncbi:hypothetical protein EHQ12_11045 [Leptospira gomenensis]|uniref:Porin n=1 Tax=Leptospira gomenensis TaxID=2484974 RepID=A0A5F1YSD9_9LEPT|nr:hypothetical protein [Leptospira gomenensis]TGK35194.1 hypothetical protein EHQ17_07065 [Leptospira gomenensis]TGK37403.1 hypothetical protein EHQ12_11045 [Leptospira gomenensis]TGK41055.1 hypothetical protein EHQ07_16825 [Leptospira gomenensis]TGK61285.1 hypothetical protein EHQ13_09505 [Leptospira gomenensis]